MEKSKYTTGIFWVLFLSLLYLPFVNKAFHIDDLAYINISKMIAWNPLQAHPVDYPYMGRMFEGMLPYEAPHPLLGVFLEAAGKRSEALKHYAAAIRVNPNLAFVHYGLGRRVGRLALALREWEQALWVLRQSLRFKKDDGEILFLMGTSLYQIGDLDQAEEFFLDVLEREPRQAASLTNLGYIYIDLGHFRKAEQMHNRAFEASPNNEQALFGLALALQKAGKTKDA